MEGMWGGQPPAADKFLNLSFYEQARQSLWILSFEG
jgi:hypothetical protein